MAAKIWRIIKAVPSAIWLGLSIFFGGLMLGLKIMRTHWKVSDAHSDAKRQFDDIVKERENLADAAKEGTNEALREELLRGLRK